MPEDQGDSAVRSRIMSQVKADLVEASQTLDRAIEARKDAYLKADRYLKAKGGDYLKGRLPQIVTIDEE